MRFINSQNNLVGIWIAYIVSNSYLKYVCFLSWGNSGYIIFRRENFGVSQITQCEWISNKHASEFMMPHVRVHSQRTHNRNHYYQFPKRKGISVSLTLSSRQLTVTVRYWLLRDTGTVLNRKLADTPVMRAEEGGTHVCLFTYQVFGEFHTAASERRQRSTPLTSSKYAPPRDPFISYIRLHWSSTEV